MPTLTQVISDDVREVVDVSSIDSRLFVLREPSQQQIQVYDTNTFNQQRALQVKHLSDDTTHSGLTSCVTNNCAYVSDFDKNTVHKVELSGNNQVLSWHVDSGPRGLSINPANNLLVTCYFTTKIVEYTTSGSLVREICLKSSDVELWPMHAIQLAGDQFVLGCWNVTSKVYDVVEVDTEGRVIVSYTNQLQSTTQHKFNWPNRLSVYKNEFILVADEDSNRIVILNRSLDCCARELDVLSVDSGLRSPICLYFDTSQNRLFVGECHWGGQRRVLIFDNVM
jgi:DNA-binding beta-propeller fold protein YncE